MGHLERCKKIMIYFWGAHHKVTRFRGAHDMLWTFIFRRGESMTKDQIDEDEATKGSVKSFGLIGNPVWLDYRKRYL